MIDFKRVRLIAMREWWTRLRQRSFQLTTLFQVLLLLVGACIPAIIAIVADDDGPSMSTILVVDRTDANILERLDPYVAQANDGVMAGSDSFVLQASDRDTDVDAARAKVDEGNVDGALIVTRDQAEELAFTYINDEGETSAAVDRVYVGASAIALEDRLARSGVPESEFAAALAPPAFLLQGVDPLDVGEDVVDEGPQFAIAFVFTVLMFIAIMLYGTWVAQGVVEEKSSRIMEIMVNAATPRDLLAGKVLGIGLAGLTQLLPMLLIGGVTFALQRRIVDAFGGDLDQLPNVDFGALSVTAIGWFLVYFLLGYVLYSAMYAALGSLVSRQEEVSQAISPMMTLMFVGYFGSIFTLGTPDSLVARVLSIIPFTSPFVMVPRLVSGNPAVWEVALSIVLLVVTLVLAILFAARVYRIGVLLYGQKPSWKAVFSKSLERAAR
ncbi:MAG: ABC transporter permease [Chloroflexia bacterium]|nr:ABC transporter permease [Chloroflexia bacterium]